MGAVCCCCSVTKSHPTFCDPMDWSTPDSSVLHYLLAQTQSIESVMPSNHLIFLVPFSSCPQSFSVAGSFPTSQLFTSGDQSSFSFSISASNEYSGLISFRIDWFDLLAAQWMLKSLLQHHCLKTSILQCSAFFRVQLSYPYMTTGKTIILTLQTFVCKVIPANLHQKNKWMIKLYVFLI